MTSTQFITLDAHEILHALTTAAYAKAGFPEGTHVTAKVVRLNAVDNKPRGATLKMEVGAPVPTVEPESAPAPSIPGEVGELAQTLGWDALYLLKAVPYALALMPTPVHSAISAEVDPWRKAIHELTSAVSLDHVEIEKLQGADERDSVWPGQVVTLARCIGNLLADREQAAKEREAVIESLSGTVNAIRQEKDAEIESVVERLVKLSRIVEHITPDTKVLRFGAGASIEDLKEHAPELYEAIVGANRNVYAALSQAHAILDRRESTSPPVEHHFATGGRSILFLGGQEPEIGYQALVQPETETIVPDGTGTPVAPKRRPETFLPPKRAFFQWGDREEPEPVLVHQITSDGLAHVEHDSGERAQISLRLLWDEVGRPI